MSCMPSASPIFSSSIFSSSLSSSSLCAVPAEQVMGVNTTEQLKQVEHVLRTRTTMANVNGERLEEAA